MVAWAIQTPTHLEVRRITMPTIPSRLPLFPSRSTSQNLSRSWEVTHRSNRNLSFLNPSRFSLVLPILPTSSPPTPSSPPPTPPPSTPRPAFLLRLSLRSPCQILIQAILH